MTPNFVTPYQVWSPNYQFYSILMINQKNNENYENENYEDEKWGNFSGIPEIFQFSPGIE